MLPLMATRFFDYAFARCHFIYAAYYDIADILMPAMF